MRNMLFFELLAGPLFAVGWEGGGRRRRQKKTFFSSARFHKNRKNLKPLRWRRKSVTRPIESWCWIGKRLSSLMKALASKCGEGAPKKKTFFSSARFHKNRKKLKPLRSRRKSVTRPIESWCWIGKRLSSLTKALVSKCCSTEMRPSCPLFSSARFQKNQKN